MSDQPTLTGQVKRFARVGATMGGVAARLAGGRLLGRDPDRGDNAAALKEALGCL